MRKMGLYVAGWVLVAAATGVPAGDESIRKIHELELSGQNLERQSELKSLAESSSEESAHWLMGEIRVDGEWIPYRRVVDSGNRWAELHRYREERAKRGTSLDDQLFLADGCHEHKLFDEERAHLHGVLAVDGDHDEARQRLGDRKIEGMWVTAEDSRTAQRNYEASLKAASRWGSHVERQIKLLSDRSPKRREAAQRALAEIRDPDVIPLLEQRLGQGTEQQQLAYLTWVCELNSWKASASIARLATASESAIVRVKAARELKGRVPEEYVPTILASMSTPISIQTESQRLGNWVFYSQHAVSETLNRKFDAHYMARFSPEFISARIMSGYGSSRGSQDGLRVIVDPRFVSAADGERAFDVLTLQSQTSAAEKNVAIQSWNDRCSRVLSDSLGVSGVSKPQDWWAWWDDDQGYVISKEMVSAQYTEEWFVGRRRGQPRRPGMLSPHMTTLALSSSCFAAGTPVMTEFGAKPIESIVRCDRVLSQDIETGELSFKPVFETTVRTSPGSAVVKFSDEQLTCTPGHPFWVNGKGWRMARELEPGDRFHSISGSVDVTGVDAGEKTEVFNLNVGDFHTYFVGKNQILTHDVSIRLPTDMALPGYLKATVAKVP